VIDDTNRNTISGTLFTQFFSGLLQKRCEFWSKVGNNDTKKLGQITTLDNLQHKSITRLKLEGDFDDIKIGVQNISIINSFIYSLYPTKYFVFGNLEFDYRNNVINNLTGWEVFDSTEIDVNDIYSYTYLFDK
jgi:hypothetical protein